MNRFLLLLLTVLAVACARPTPAKAPAYEDAGGGLYSGHRLGGTYVNGVATLPINLAGGSGSVINVLPTGNQAAQGVSCTGDISCSGTTASEATTVTAISGTSPILVSPNTFQWAASATPTLSQATTSASTGNIFTYCSSSASSASPGTPGSCFSNIAAPTGAGNEGFTGGQRAGVKLWQLGPLVGSPGFGALYLGNVTPSATNFNVTSDGTSTYLNAPSSILYFYNGGTGGTQYANWTTTGLNFFSGAYVLDPWQGSKSTQTENIAYIPIVGSTPVASAGTIYTYATTTGTEVSLEAHLTFKGGANGAVGCVGGFFNSSGTVTQTGSTASLYAMSGTSASCTFAISGTSVNVQGISGTSSTCLWQGYVVAILN